MRNRTKRHSKASPRGACGTPNPGECIELARRLEVAARGLELAYAIGCPHFADALPLARQAAETARACATTAGQMTAAVLAELEGEAESAEDHAWRARYFAAVITGQVQRANLPREEIQCQLMELIALRAEGAEIPVGLMPFAFPTLRGMQVAKAVMQA